MMGKVPSTLFVGYPRPGCLEKQNRAQLSNGLNFLDVTPVYFSSAGAERGGIAGSRLPGGAGFPPV